MCNITQRPEITRRMSVLESNEEVDRLFFEFANRSRIDIMRELQTKNLKMQELARRLDLTATEAFRQLERLSASLLVQRQSDGSYALTQYGKLELNFASTMEFVLKNKQYFLNHDVSLLPQQFVNRIGELSQSNLRMGLIEATTKSSQMIGQAEKYMWGISIEQLNQPFNDIAKQIAKGVEYKIISPQSPTKLPNLENRTLVDSPVILALTEKEAAICFRFVDGRVDYASFIGSDPTFLNWVKELFLYYWDKGKRA